MYCRYCGKQVDEDAVECPHCGKPTGVEAAQPDNQSAVDEQPAAPLPETQPDKRPETPSDEQALASTPKQCPLCTTALLAAIFGCVGFVASIVMGSMLFANYIALLYMIGWLAVLPSLASLGAAVCVLHAPKDKLNRIVSLVTMCVAGFSLFYTFLAVCVAA